MQNTLSINSFFFITANMLYTLELIVKAIEAKRFSQQNMQLVFDLQTVLLDILNVYIATVEQYVT